MTSTDNSKLISEFIQKIDKIDQLRKENFFSVFPELEALKNA
jgi:hypothetical protein